ncbi:hypothetical protein F8M41_001766 [Gigaspora margarita]|uniref:Uncharacterized protein n=1 Tax=Gigaspora margarita TaxID=4874 RepID=A0A8H4A9S2_GIGMA|nr:hypothetical protein F8M41_001766 [Gigaspora margarita]
MIATLEEQVDEQLNKADRYVKVVVSSTRTINIDDVQREQKAMDDEFLQSDSKDNSVMKHQMHKQRTTVKSGLIFVGKIMWNIVIFMIMLGIMMGPNVDSYAGLDHDQEVGVIACNLIGNISYDRCIINSKGFERNYELNRGDVDFEDEVHGV